MSNDLEREIQQSVALGRAYSMQVAKRRIDELFARVEKQQALDPDVEGPFDNIVLEDLRTKLIDTAMYRDVTEDDLLKASGQHEKEWLAELHAQTAFWDACRAQSDSLRVYYVYNTADRKLTVLAKDAKCARFFAHRAGHILEEKNGSVMVMKPEVEAALRQSGSALARALRDGHPGVVETLGNNVIMKESERVFTPMTVVPKP
ncbi:hypothetical protein [Sphingomonas yantingensis]|uniref:Uncharacterized protein n=1 Tax=Sphingomonas yantingensis TaxID=1241761 RepID=A0A7W9ASZ3_9SPHN|nr:hypothetical protein [Sphingomonas yantingensis]MBB5700025.1 hypothetical protein [Sphingomonas yantingensis]